MTSGIEEAFVQWIDAIDQHLQHPEHKSNPFLLQLISYHSHPKTIQETSDALKQWMSETWCELAEIYKQHLQSHITAKSYSHVQTALTQLLSTKIHSALTTWIHSSFLTHSSQHPLNEFTPALISSWLTEALPVNHYSQHLSHIRNALVELHKHSRLFSDSFLSVNQSAITRFLEQFNRDTTQSLETLHEIWIETYDKTLAQTLHSPEFVQHFSNIINAQITLATACQGLRGQCLESLGIASNHTLLSAFAKIHALEKKVRVIEQQQNTIHNLEKKIAQLERLLSHE